MRTGIQKNRSAGARHAGEAVPCILCGCHGDELAYARLGRDAPADLVALCLNHAVMVDRMFNCDPGWRGYEDRAEATGTIIKMLAGTGAHGTVAS